MKPVSLLLAALLSFCSWLPAAESRLALLMGVGSYDGSRFQPLPGIKTDLAMMSAALKKVGFDVTVISDPSLLQAEDAIDAFGTKLVAQKGVGLFYFSGHGGEYEGKNYLIPRGARVKEIRDIKEQAVAANRVLNRMEASGARVNIVFLDCCRNDLTKAVTDSGMAAMSARGTFIGYATASEKEAAASAEGSPYTQILAKNLVTPGLSILDMHTQVTAQVQDLTKEAGQEQTPFSYSGLRSTFYFVEGGLPAPTVPVTVAPPGVPTPPVSRPGSTTAVRDMPAVSTSSSIALQRNSTGQLEGTVWQLSESDGETTDLHFLAGGVVKFYVGSAPVRTGTWEAGAAGLKITAGTAVLTGSMNGGRLQGNGRSTTAGFSPWTWTASPR